MYLFFDTETTGLPKNYKAPVTDIRNWPRMVQIAWIMYDNDGILVDNRDFIIKPEGYTIPVAVSQIHGITTQKAINEGHDLSDVLGLFNEQIEKANYLVGHNIGFDEKIVGAEFVRKQLPTSILHKKKLCTMDASTNFCKIPGQYGYKWPRLSELHQKLFGRGFDEAHNAAADIQATALCFWKMREMHLI